MKIKYLVVHCSDTPDDRDVDAAEIHRWHTQERGWDGIGYHAVIKRDGTLEHGRPVYWVGSHLRGKNSMSLGVCLIGRNHFNESQLDTLHKLLDKWTDEYPEAEVKGHYELDPKKTCPNYDAAVFYSAYKVVKRKKEIER